MPGYHPSSGRPARHLRPSSAGLCRDAGRATAGASPIAGGRLNESPLGAGALAGTSFPIDPAATAAALGFARPMANSMDAVSARDFAIEFLAAGAILATHLSRFAEELVLWTSEGFRFVALGDAFTTGSSIMPQKRNPDAAELVRGKAGQAIGALVQLLVVLKGLPLTYGKDMQEDKETVFLAVDNLSLSLAAMTGMVRDLTADTGAMRAGLRPRLHHRDRSRRRAGARSGPGLPRGPSHHRHAGAPGRAEGLRPRRAAAGRDAAGRAPHRRRSSGPASRSRPRSRAAPASAARRRRMCAARWRRRGRG